MKMKRQLALLVIVALLIGLLPMGNVMVSKAASPETKEKESVYLENIPIIECGGYDGNEGDSFVYPIGSHQYTRGNVGVDGNTYSHGIEVWVARWNYTKDKSWTYATFDLDKRYTKLSGRALLIDSYNVTDFDTTLYFYGDGQLIQSYQMTPQTMPFDITLDVVGIDNLKIYAEDNGYFQGGTSFGLTEMALTKLGDSDNIDDKEPIQKGLSNPRIDADGVTTWDCVWFGNYWQEDKNEDGETDQNDAKTPIKWRVLSVDGDDVFLLADKNLDCQRYNNTYTDVTWETCTIRSWLNGYGASSNICEEDYTSDNFLDNAFSLREQAAIKNTVVVNADNPEYGTEGGNDTVDKVYLLSIDEALNPLYGFVSDHSVDAESRRAKNTAYAKTQGAWVTSLVEYDRCAYWWLRLLGSFSSYVSGVYGSGYVHLSGVPVNDDTRAIRPALHLNLSYASNWSYAGTVTSEGGVDEQATSGPAASGTPKPWDLPTLLPYVSEEPVPTESPVASVFNEYIYRANHLTDPSEVEGATMENSFINADTPSGILVKGLQENGFDGTADAWRAVTRTCEAASDASKIVDYVMEEKDIYEALIFNILESVSKNNVKDALNTSMIKDASELFGVIKNDLKTKYTLDVTEDMKNSNLTPEMKERTKELAEEYFSKKGITKAADWLKGAADIMKALDTTESFCEEVAAYTSIRNMSDSMKTVLIEMKKKCPSDNRALSAALDDCIKVMEASDQEFEHQIMHGRIKVVGKEAAKTGISKFWKSIVAGKIKALCPEAAIVKAAYETSKYITNFMFNTDEITEKYYKMLASTEMYFVLRDAYASLKDTYTARKTVDCAGDYLSVVDVVFCALRIDCECAYEYVDSLDSSNMNKLCGLFGCESDASALKDTIDSIERNYYSEYELVLTSWIFYLEEDFPSEYENYKHLTDESVERIKEYRVHCPVDVYVYDSSGNLSASVVNDVPVSSGVTVLVDGDSKTFYLPEGESYTFTYIGNDAGTMDIEIAEYETDGSLLRTASFNALPLLSGTTYHSSENGRFLEAAEYQITDSENKKRNVDFDSASPYGTQTCTISVEQGMILRNGLSDWTVKAGKNEILDLSAYVPDGYEFDAWQVLSGDIEIRDINNTETKAVAGDRDAVVKAVIKEKKEGDNTPLPVVSQRPAATVKPAGSPAVLPNGNHMGVTSGGQQPAAGAETGKLVSAPRKPVIKSVKNTKGKKIKIILREKVQGAAGYQVQYAINKKFTKAKKFKDTGSKTSVWTITRLIKGKTYYVRVRAYKKSSGKRLYGKWSKVKKVKITK